MIPSKVRPTTMVQGEDAAENEWLICESKAYPAVFSDSFFVCVKEMNLY